MKIICTCGILILMLVCSRKAISQASIVTIKGKITNAANQPLPSASVRIRGSNQGVTADSSGNFSITVGHALPLTLIISNIGFLDRKITVNNTSETISISLNPGFEYGEVFVRGSSRVPEHYLTSPGTVGLVSTADIRNAASPDYYSRIGNLTGVDLTTASIGFQTISTRGFNASGNLRFNQFTDGIDNQAPGLSFSVGSIVGLTELDADNMEIILGESSALYGSGGTNGTLLITSKDPFKYQGLSVQYKQGINHLSDPRHPAAPVFDGEFRYAVVFKNKARQDKLAVKIAAKYFDAEDWHADDSTNLLRNNVLFSTIKPGNRRTDPAYDGVNFFGDEVSTSAGGLTVSRQGYEEKDLVDYNAYNMKITGGVYYKFSKNVEASVQGYFGKGTTVYTASDRYALKNLQVGQYKFELKSDNWFLRAYTTQENSGDSYIATGAAIYINRAWKTDQQWFGSYFNTYFTTPSYAHPQEAARAKAEAGRFLPGTPQFQDAFHRAISTPITDGGAKFTDKTNLYHTEGQYHFISLKKFADVLAGASYRVYHLNSGGTIFADTDGPINIYEYGAYIQLQKTLLDSVLKLTASGRFDKNENFKGRFTPRFSALLKVAKDNYFRLSYQTGYRFPSTQDQYLNLQTPKAKLIGGLPQFSTFYHFDTAPAYTAESISAFRSNTGGLVQAPFAPIKPETVNAYEIGYRGRITKQLLIDAYGYMSRYKSFIGRQSVGRGISADDTKKDLELRSSSTTTYYTFAVNSPETIKANGWGLGLEYRFQKNTTATFNVSGDQLQHVPEGFATFFNSPKIRYNIGLSAPAAAKTFGFSVVYRWQGKINWESTFGSGLVPAYGSMDAQISYLMPKVKTLIKLGGSNVFNNYYRSAFGNPYVGALYYISFGYNIF